MATWAKLAVSRGYVVLQIDSLGSRGVDTVCYGPKGDVNPARGVRDALQAADHLRSLPFVDKKRVAHIGFSWGAMVALLGSSRAWRSALPGGEGFTAAVSVYPGCFTIQPKNAPSFEIVQTSIDRPTLVLMGDKDTETPAAECVAKLGAIKAAGAPVEWHVFANATHCWDCAHLNGFSKTDVRGNQVAYRYSADFTRETEARIFAFLERAMPPNR
jgi:dienelactone hydrolase